MTEGETGAKAEGPGAQVDAPKHAKRVTKKVIVVLVVASLLGASGFYVWYEYFRHWDIEDLEDAVVIVNEYGPVIDGFDTDLAGRTVTVDVVVAELRSWNTTVGQMTVIYPEGMRYVSLLQWGQAELAVGDRVQMEVSFEWGTVNGIRSVYSPQVGSPGLRMLMEYSWIFKAVNWANGESSVDVKDTGDDVTVTLDKIADPVPLQMSRCSVKAGTEASKELMDMYGWYDDKPDLDTILDLTSCVGQNGTIEFNDENDDGYLDDGDSFALHDLVRPVEPCGAQTYLMKVERDLYPEEPEEDMGGVVFAAYLVMTHNGTMWVTDDQTRTGTAHSEAVPGGVAVTLDAISVPTSWDEISLLVAGGDDYVRFYPNATSLTGEEDATDSCGVADIGEVKVECVAKDSDGNGLLEATDRIELIAKDGTQFNDSIYLSVEYLVTDTLIVRKDLIFGLQPISNCTLLASDDDVSVVLGPVHNGTGYDYESLDVVWHGVLVRLTDGVSTAQWNATYDLLCGESPSDWLSEEAALGGLSAVCRIVDLQGNGLANAGDSVCVTIQDEGVFHPGTEYTISLVYVPTGEDIYSAAFSE